MSNIITKKHKRVKLDSLEKAFKEHMHSFGLLRRFETVEVDETPLMQQIGQLCEEPNSIPLLRKEEVHSVEEQRRTSAPPYLVAFM